MKGGKKKRNAKKKNIQSLRVHLIKHIQVFFSINLFSYAIPFTTAICPPLSTCEV